MSNYSKYKTVKVGIIGAGPAGLALYALMMKDGTQYDPILYASSSHVGTLKGIFSNSTPLKLFDERVDTGFVMDKSKIKITHRVDDITRNVDMLVNTLPINAHIPFFDEAFADVKRIGKTIPMINLSGGFSVFDHILKQRQAGLSSSLIPIASAHTLPYAARVGDSGISILNRRPKTLVSIDDDAGLGGAVAELAEFMGTAITLVSNHLYCAVDRSSYVLHPVITALNFNKIEMKEPFFFYKDGLTPTAYRCLVAAGHERREVCMSLGFCDFISPEDRMKNFVSTYMADFSEIRPPASAKHRFFLEDIPYGLVFLRTLGAKQGIDMPVCDAVITLSSIICDVDFWKDNPFDLTKNQDLFDLVSEYSQNK